MKKKTIFLTGAGEGIGKLTAIGMAMQYNDADILIHGRNKERLNKSSEEIKKNTSNGNIETYLADFSSCTASAQAYDLNARNKLNKIGNLYTEPGMKSGMI
jgi:short-subunit dehydrogenase